MCVYIAIYSYSHYVGVEVVAIYISLSVPVELLYIESSSVSYSSVLASVEAVTIYYMEQKWDCLPVAMYQQSWLR